MPSWKLLSGLSLMLSGDISRCHRYVGSWKRKNSFRCWANLIPFWSEDSAGKLLGSGIKQEEGVCRYIAGRQARHECSGLSPAQGSVPPDQLVQEHKSQVQQQGTQGFLFTESSAGKERDSACACQC